MTGVRSQPLSRESTGAWVIYHGNKTAVSVNRPSEFPALDTAAKAASLLSQLAATAEAKLDKSRVNGLARAARLNPNTELPSLIDILKKKRLIDSSSSGEIVVLRLTSRATVGHAADIFTDQEPTKEEMASIGIAELTSGFPIVEKTASEWVSDNFELRSDETKEFLIRAESIGFVDSEGKDNDKLYFNGNIFTRDNISGVNRIIGSLSSSEQKKINELDDLLNRHGCVGVQEAGRILGIPLFEKTRAAGMFDVNDVQIVKEVFALSRNHRPFTSLTIL